MSQNLPEQEFLQLLRAFYQRFREARDEAASTSSLPCFARFADVSSADSLSLEVWPMKDGAEALRWPALFFIRRPSSDEGWTLLPNRLLKVNPSGKSSRRCWLFDPGQKASEAELKHRIRNLSGQVGFLPMNFSIQSTTKTQSYTKQSRPIDGLKQVRFSPNDEPFVCEEDDRMCLIRVSESETSLAALAKRCRGIEYQKLTSFEEEAKSGAHGLSLDKPLDEKGRTQLYLHCESRDMGSWPSLLLQVKALIARKADINRTTSNGSTPLIAAAHKGNLELVSYLLESRANPNLKSQGGHAAVHHASWKGDVRVFELLYYHPEALWVTNQPLTAEPVLDNCRRRCSADSHAGPEECWNFLIWAHQQKHAQAHALIESLQTGSVAATRQHLTTHNIDWPVDQRTGNTALHVAAEAGQQGACRALLLEFRASPDAQRLDGCTPLHLAALHARTEIVQLLLENGANANAQSASLECAVHLASYCGAEHAFELLYAATAASKRRPLHSMHTACVDDGDIGPVCPCRDCQMWAGNVWKVQFAGLACGETDGEHVCKHRMLFHRQRAEAHAALSLQAEVERLRAQLEAVRVDVEAGSRAVGKRARGLSDLDAHAGEEPAGLDAAVRETEEEGGAVVMMDEALLGVGGEMEGAYGDETWGIGGEDFHPAGFCGAGDGELAGGGDLLDLDSQSDFWPYSEP